MPNIPNMHEVKLKAEVFCGQTITNELFTLVINSCLRELTPIAKKEKTDVITDIVEVSGEKYAEINLEDIPVQIMLVMVDVGSNVIVPIVGYGEFHNTNQLVYTIDGNKVLLKTNGVTVKSVTVRYYIPLPTYDVGVKEFDWASKEVPLVEHWFSDLFAFYVAKDFFANLEDEDSVRLYQIMYDRELKRFKSEVGRRHLNNSNRYSKGNGFF